MLFEKVDIFILHSEMILCNIGIVIKMRAAYFILCKDSANREQNLPNPI